LAYKTLEADAPEWQITFGTIGFDWHLHFDKDMAAKVFRGVFFQFYFFIIENWNFFKINFQVVFHIRRRVMFQICDKTAYKRGTVNRKRKSEKNILIESVFHEKQRFKKITFVLPDFSYHSSPVCDYSGQWYHSDNSEIFHTMRTC
jgi:hypothetical protein